MNEERAFILKMVEEGKITAAEAEALLDALDDKHDEDERPEDSRERGSASGDETGKAEEGERKGKRASQDLAGQLSESIQAILRNVPNITEDVREGWNEVRKDLKQSLQEVKEEMKKKRLVDLSGLGDLLTHMRDVGFGHSHEFEERVVGEFSEEAALPEFELATKNGSLLVSGWDQASYEVVVRKKVYSRDEEGARRTAESAVEIERGSDRLRIDGRGSSGVTVSMEVRVPAKRSIALEATTQNGSVTLKELTLNRGRATTTNGSVHVEDVRARRLVAATVNGKVEGEAVDASDCEVRTVNGSIAWEGRSVRAELKTVNGPVRYAPDLVDADDGAGESVNGVFNVKSVNGGIRLMVPRSGSVGMRLDVKGRSVEIDEEKTGLHVESRGGRAASRHVTAATTGYEGAHRRFEVTAKTVNGSIRIEERRERERPSEPERAPEGTAADGADAPDAT